VQDGKKRLKLGKGGLAPGGGGTREILEKSRKRKEIHDLRNQSGEGNQVLADHEENWEGGQRKWDTRKKTAQWEETRQSVSPLEKRYSERGEESEEKGGGGLRPRENSRGEAIKIGDLVRGAEKKINQANLSKKKEMTKRV